MAEMGLAPLNTCQFPFHILEKAMAAWNEQAAVSGYPDDPRRPVMASGMPCWGFSRAYSHCPG